MKSQKLIKLSEVKEGRAVEIRRIDEKLKERYLKVGMKIKVEEIEKNAYRRFLRRKSIVWVRSLDKPTVTETYTNGKRVSIMKTWPNIYPVREDKAQKILVSLIKIKK